ncbi:sporulation membrane protein YtaF [Virgibacillus ainsalahensis]
MAYYIGLFLLVIAVSLDGFSVGVTYGLRKIRVPIIALAIIMLCSGIIVLLAMTIGQMLGYIISPDMTKILGGSILIFLGLFSLYSIIRPEKETKKNQNIWTTVLTTPDKADIDHSGIISPGEAVLLGAALALDAFGAGIGASMLGYSPVLTAILIALMSGLFVFCGIQTGALLAKNKKLRQMVFLPPVLLIAIGISNIL